MTATEWAHLPNAALIDRVLADAVDRPQVWHAARGTTLGTAGVAARDAARDAAWEAAQDAVWDAAWVAARDAVWDAVCDALLALIAWDDAGLMLDMPVPALRLFAANGSHAAVLMLPAAIALGGKA